MGTINDWNDVLEISFSHAEFSSERTFNYYCSVSDLNGKKNPICYFEERNKDFMKNGRYSYYSSKSLGTRNTFLTGMNVHFFNFDITNIYVEKELVDVSYVSTAGSSIILKYIHDKESRIPHIYPNKESEEYLKNCHYFKFGDTLYDYIFCIINGEELKYFQSMNNPSNNPVLYGDLCGKKNTGLNVMRLDSSKYPIYKVYYFKVFQQYFEGSRYVFSQTSVTLEFEVFGNYFSATPTTSNLFFAFINLEKNNKNETFMLRCHTPYYPLPSITCSLLTNDKERHFYDEIYLTRIYLPAEFNSPYDIIIPVEMKERQVYSSSRMIKSSLFIILLMVLFCI